MIHATFPIEAVAWQRPRMNRGRFFTAPAVKKFETQIKRLALAYAPLVPLYGPLDVVIEIYLKKPKRTKYQVPCVRPDIDNYSKVLLDALTEMFWFDDGQIVTLLLSKRYCKPEDKPSIKVSVYGREHE